MTDPCLLHQAYVAGIIDGEGSIFSRRRNPHVTVSNTSHELMCRLALLGGHLQARDPRRGLGTLPAWDWTVTGETAAIILRSCLPWLVIKADKARRALDEWDGVTGSNHRHFAREARLAMTARGWPR